MKIIIVGGGASGLFLAGFAAKSRIDVTVAEHSGKTASKVLITGKGRCNVTNDCDEEEFLRNVRTNPKFLYSAIYGFNTKDTMNFFEGMGVALKTERGRRVFPVCDKAARIKDALDRHAQKARIIHEDVAELIFDEDRVLGVVTSSGKRLLADRVIVATGGLSYKATGSTGDGYRFAARAGHTVVEPTASLVPLVAQGNKCAKMMGLSLRNVKLTVKNGKKQLFSQQGEMLFTHFGISGPLVLSASCHIKDKDIQNCTAYIDTKPALSEEVLYKRICADFEKLQAKQAANSLDLLLPKSMIEPVLEDWGIDRTKIVNQITKEERQRLVKVLKAFEIPLKSKYKIDVAVITSGGVSVKEINPATMESKKKKGLYFIGEVLDVDAYTGGYNLQIAFSTAYACRQALREQNNSKES